MKLLYQPWIRGAHNIPETGPAILASNHLAVIDSFFLPLMIDREVVFMGKSDYFTGTGFKGKLVASFMRSVGTIPVDRTGGKKSLAALRVGLKRLEDGGLFGIYPEGTRSPDGRLHRGKTGVSRLALESGAPVIPVAMIGTDIAQPIGVKIPRLHRIGIVVGEPLDFSRYKGLEGDRFVLRAITDEIMYNLMCLSGQEYVDRYAADVKKELAAQGKFAGPLPGGAKDSDDSPQGDTTLQGATPSHEQNSDEPEPMKGPGGRRVPELEVPQPFDDDTDINHGVKNKEGEAGRHSDDAAAAKEDVESKSSSGTVLDEDSLSESKNPKAHGRIRRFAPRKHRRQ